MAGFDNGVLLANNVDFTGAHVSSGSAQVTSNGQLLIGSAVAPNIRVGTLTAGAGISITNGAGSITISNTSAGFTWNVVTSASNPVTLVAENGYIPKGAGVVNFVLPAAAAIGDTFRIIGYGNLWTVAQNANQQIFLGIQSTTVGATGSIAATGIKDSIELVCVTANLEWVISDSIGNITFI